MVKLRYVIVAVVILALVGMVILLIPNDKKRIKKQLNRLSDVASKKGKESPIVSGMRGKKFAELMTDPCRLKGSIHSLGGKYTRGEAAMVLSGVRSQLESINLTFHDITIEFPEKDRALVLLTARFVGYSGGRISEVRELKCKMQRVDKEWLFNECEAVEVLEK